VANSYRITEVAAADLAALADHSIERFGVAQARRYGDALFDVFDMLVAFPMIGTDQGQIEPGLRRFVHASHAIYYRLAEDEIVIVSLLGPGQDPLTRFSK
jgi:toxin ParE1/3/4